LRVLPGQYYDAETGNHYNYFRDYDPRIGRYIESDPIGLVSGANTFGYVSANPLGSIDILGLAVCTYSISRHTLSCSPNDPRSVGGVNLGPDGLFSGQGDCENNPSNECQKAKDRGPIPEDDYDLVPYDGTRDSTGTWWRAQPKSWLTRAAQGLGIGSRDGGFLLHPGRISAGCITRKWGRNDPFPDDYRRLNDLLKKESGRNTLKVTQ
jgi:RHS repeat-associated protein